MTTGARCAAPVLRVLPVLTRKPHTSAHSGHRTADRIRRTISFACVPITTYSSTTAAWRSVKTYRLMA
jgi:hypothetical protein